VVAAKPEKQIMKNASIPRDRSKIILDSENQVRHWTRHLGVTQEELARAIERVGNSAAEHMAAPTNAAFVKKVLANSEPSTHGPKRTSIWR
jgi:Protein of unknown function (DUF3606)